MGTRESNQRLSVTAPGTGCMRDHESGGGGGGGSPSVIGHPPAAVGRVSSRYHRFDNIDDATATATATDRPSTGHGAGKYTPAVLQQYCI